ncbi:MAG TPA: hypothetical protein PLO25_02220 [Candidatus Saccharibacteria bacterium]|nr:hypothetical protein [Candidatus Saccharibacteria bacterium]
MKNKIKMMLAGLVIMPVFAFGASLAMPSISVFAADDLTIQEGVKASQGEGQPEELFGDSGVFTTIINVMLYIIGAVSVLMLVYGGIRYTISGGDTNAVTAAKNTILYAVIGIVVALMSFAIVNFVVNRIAS